MLDELRQRGLEDVLEPARRAGGEAVSALIRDLASLDWRALDRQRAALQAASAGREADPQPPELHAASTSGAPGTAEAAAAGWEALRAGRVALATVAGGQASRLGFEAPKGAFPLGPVSGASLFQILAGQVRRLQERAGTTLPWIIQTGPENHAATRRFFERRAYFGLHPRAVEFVCQGTLPALSPEGGLLLAAPGRLFRSPDGHGGFFAALARAGTWERLRAAGADTLFYCQVDNPLCRMGDPVFLGLHLGAKARMSVKVVEKIDPAERVGLIVLLDGRTACIEYSDLPPELAGERAPDGGLRFRAGNIAVHAFDLAFAAACGGEGAALPLHLACKEVLALADGLEPEVRPAVKFESFVFDALPRAERTVVQMCVRAEEFAPVKNRVGVDSPASARAALDARARAWIAAALPGLEPAPEGALELEPGLALDREDLAARSGEIELTACGRLLRRRRPG